MATPHALPPHVLTPFRPDPAGPARRVGRLRAGLLIGAASALTFTVLPGTAAAVPGNPTSTAEAAQLVADASRELEVVSEKLNEAKVDLERQQSAVDSAEKAAFEAQQQRAALDGRIRQLARSAYTGGNSTMNQLDVLLSSGSAEELVSQMGTLEAIAGHTTAAVSEVAEASDRAEDSRDEARSAREEAERSVADIQAQQQALEAKIADYQRQYEALDAAQRALVERAQGDSQPVRASRGTERSAPSAAPAPARAAAASGAAAVAVDTALAQVGDRYVWGAGGPDAFDCSGLTSYAYAAAGISLPHSSRSQSQMGRAVSRSELQPGDLLFFYSPVSHVGMYIGNGQMVHASTSSQPVKVASIDSMPSYNSARRVA
ncbi:Cell wall-associated hydrolase, NlpC family [Blastococcus aurantiacus]|uniref:Cell wall-associated hydrolase, NlpC family n=1 Tax=Blastococcus aurantiacus TaxID=1550231 RepID=A0A1G7LWX0_9ACTN|nr:C40 family peptidase [Blastococcus aurantiacus]SDF53933.1 Cell wall-associated hydrolase, NlpC family [Blastococcus aurantiacus]